MAGKPATIELSLIFFVTPLLAATTTLSPIFMCPAKPDCPPTVTLLPINTLPEIPVWAAIQTLSPIITLCAI